MPIAIDATSTQTGGEAAFTTLSWSHTTSGDDRILYVEVAFGPTTAETVSSITYNSVALTEVISENGGDNNRISIWRLIAPATGANTVLVTMSASTLRGCAAAISLTGVDQTTPDDTASAGTATDTTPTINITNSATDDLVLGFLNFRNETAATVGAGQTTRVTQTGNPTSQNLYCSSEPGAAGTITISWSGASNLWKIAAFSVNPVAVVANPVYQPWYHRAPVLAQ